MLLKTSRKKERRQVNEKLLSPFDTQLRKKSLHHKIAKHIITIHADTSRRSSIDEIKNLSSKQTLFL